MPCIVLHSLHTSSLHPNIWHTWHRRSQSPFQAASFYSCPSPCLYCCPNKCPFSFPFPCNQLQKTEEGNLTPEFFFPPALPCLTVKDWLWIKCLALKYLDICKSKGSKINIAIFPCTQMSPEPSQVVYNWSNTAREGGPWFILPLDFTNNMGSIYLSLLTKTVWEHRCH